MATTEPGAIVRAYDLGGYGDIAGAMRVASFLQRVGTPVEIKAKSKSALQKLRALNPDCNFSMNGQNPPGTILLDVAGHYRDNRNPANIDVPHQFTEDMDNPENRRRVVPIYLKTGLTVAQPQIPVAFKEQQYNPMFYRPFREWDLPKPGERDARAQIIDIFNTMRTHSERFLRALRKSQLERTIEDIERVAFVHLSPAIQTLSGAHLLEHPYFYAVHTAAINNDPTFGLGLFVHTSVEQKMTQAALQKHWGVVSSKGEVIKYNPDIPTLIFLGPQPQLTTTGLFLSADIPNLVTGDLSLSDALYGLIAMEGQGFFYETPGWKVPTHNEMSDILARYSPLLSHTYFVGSNFLEHDPNDPVIKKAMDTVVAVFSDARNTDAYKQAMRDAVRAEIHRRFGDVPVAPAPTDGFYIPPGTPYLLQDATAQVVQTLRDDPTTFAEVEGIRNMLENGVPVTVNVTTGVLEPAPYTSHTPFSLYDLIFPYAPYSKKNKHTKQYQHLESLITGFVYGKLDNPYSKKTGTNKQKHYKSELTLYKISTKSYLETIL